MGVASDGLAQERGLRAAPLAQEGGAIDELSHGAQIEAGRRRAKPHGDAWSWGGTPAVASRPLAAAERPAGPAGAGRGADGGPLRAPPSSDAPWPPAPERPAHAPDRSAEEHDRPAPTPKAEPRTPPARRLAALARSLGLGAMRALYPPACVACAAPVEEDGALCPACWREAAFVTGAACDLCGAPLPGQGGAPAACDDCLRTPRPWAKGRAALAYRGTGRALALRLKHGDRPDLARPLGLWMARAGRGVLDGDPLLVPVPLHWTRLLRRRYNQAALLAQGIARAASLEALPDALVRPRRTASLGGQGREARFQSLAAAIRPNRRQAARLQGRPVVLVDDVMASGATLHAAAEAAREAGASEVRVLVLARAGRDQ